MPKRKREESKEERWKRKLKRYEEKLNDKRRNRIIYSSDEENYVIPEVHMESEEMPIDDVYADVIPNDLIEDYAEKSSVVPTSEEQGSTSLAETPAGEQNTITVTPNEQTEILDPEILEALGDCEMEKDEWGENVHHEISQRFSQILINGLKKEKKQELLKKYLVPKNSPLAKAPTLNPEIGAMLSETCRNRDKRFSDKQEQIGRALSALQKAMTDLLKKEFNVPDIIRTLNDTGKLLADSHHAETESRRFLIIPFVDKSLVDSFKDRKRDNFLFGDKLNDLVKTSRGIKKMSQQIIATPTTSSAAGNWKGPSDRIRQQRNGQPYTTRPGGQRTTYPARGRAAPPAAHPSQPRRWTHQPPPLPAPPARRPPLSQTPRQLPPRLRQRPPQ